MTSNQKNDTKIKNFKNTINYEIKPESELLKCTKNIANEYANNIIEIDESNYNKLNYCYKSSKDNNKYYENCALKYKNPWLIRNNDKCEYIDYIKNKIEDKKNIIYIQKISEEINEEKWYDWFTIPDYHNGNKYQIVNNKFYKPCKYNYIPTLNSNNEAKCINKNYKKFGLIEGTFSYTPISIIFLLGTSINDLKKIYISELEKTIKYLKNNDKYEINPKLNNIIKENNLEDIFNENIYYEAIYEIYKSAIEIYTKNNELRTTKGINEFEFVPLYNKKNKKINIKPNFVYNSENIYLEKAYEIAELYSINLKNNTLDEWKKNLILYNSYDNDNINLEKYYIKNYNNIDDLNYIKSKLFNIFERACYICFGNIENNYENEIEYNNYINNKLNNSNRIEELKLPTPSDDELIINKSTLTTYSDTENVKINFNKKKNL